VEALSLTTESVAAHERLAYWRDVVCATFVELDCDSPVPEGFFGSVTNSSLCGIQFSNVQSGPQHVVRTRSRIAQSDLDYFLLSLQVRGQGMLAQDGRTAILKPGDFTLYDTTRPYDLSFKEDFNQLVLRLPREIVSDRLTDTEQLTALCISGAHGVGRLASTFLHQLHQQLDEIDPLSVARLHASVVDLLATALGEQRGTKACRNSESQVLQRRRICAFIDRNLANPDLNCAMIAAEHRVSERYLRKLFEGSAMSVSEWIWSRRLDQARRDLADPLRAHISVTAIGYDVGFKDGAHFSRAFRAKFGVTPSTCRAEGLPAGSAPVARRRS
jgi:AraC-like DNA-binding protein